jgi:hypothetical protein
MVHMPPDLSRLGDELTAAAARAVAERRRRRRRLAHGAATAAAALLSVVVLAPAALSPDSGTGPLLARRTAEALPIRPPERPPYLLARATPDIGVEPVRLPDRRPAMLPSLTRHRDA